MKKIIIITLSLSLVFVSLIFVTIKVKRENIANYSVVSPLLESLSFDDVIKSSNLIIVGDVKEVKSFYIEEKMINEKGEPVEPIKTHKTIVSEADVKVERLIKGELKEERVKVRFLGGKVGEETMIACDLPELIKGERVVLCLDNSIKYIGEGDYWTIFHLGKFNIKDNFIEENPLVSEKNLTLEELISRIQNVNP